MKLQVVNFMAGSFDRAEQFTFDQEGMSQARTALQERSQGTHCVAILYLVEAPRFILDLETHIGPGA